MVRMKTKCIAMLLMALAIYLTIICVNLDKVFFFFGSKPLTCAFTIWLYIGAVALFYVVYNGQIRKITLSRMLNIVMLQSFIMFLWFTFVNLIQLYPFTVIETHYCYWYWPQDFFPSIYATRYIVAISALLTVVCFTINWILLHKRAKY
ncbi:MAG: hypothetical protein FWB84_06320 [Candidatus Bathyarchaeota archaeon]|uniref:hypothetical protein n=1 Tax=Candidatus Bathycorpusculum sp. TaxID=2994959 RepID=UPI00282C2196|nr:hypothetical protein [Candidatus Termiticorpusculum sp.]MCL2256648.1 hypothetical protein [Candidatus Termiticorpusculum sp.]MCL2293173.1 hypothetical protein [Candidatus Termiticorpusculum sp.]